MGSGDRTELNTDKGQTNNAKNTFDMVNRIFLYPRSGWGPLRNIGGFVRGKG